MATWRLVRSLDTLRGQVRAGSPGAVPPATPASSWGTVGDLAHQDGVSDHNPKVYPALGSTPVVCAADFPHAPALGLDGAWYTEQLRLSRDPRIGYVIFNGRIFSGHQVGSVPAFTWRKYNEADQHREHWHASTVHTAIADDPRPFNLGVTMTAPLTVSDQSYVDTVHRVAAIVHLSPTIGGGTDKGKPNELAAALSTLTAAAAADATRDAALLAAVTALTSNGGPDSAPIILAIQEAAEQTRGYVEQLQQDLAEERKQNAVLRERLAAAFGPGSE